MYNPFQPLSQLFSHLETQKWFKLLYHVLKYVPHYASNKCFMLSAKQKALKRPEVGRIAIGYI